ncbi:zinc ribbon domain-containing protein [Salinibacter ruber]|uniref:zinc ribbon domain-containing protein n=1 Tax=Salinibacter ruber TaxID=146919 RepID=UPI00207372A8|nr:zinc ribbon domain-containing protein [Salinibacter ruber]
MITGILLVQAVAFAVLSGIVASNKNRDAFGWGLIGFIFGLFGFIAAVAVGEVEGTQSSSRQRSQPSSTREFNPDEHEKKCPDCAEYIKLEARVCKHCGHEFSKKEVERQIEEVKRKFDEKNQEGTMLYCERSKISVEPNPDETCPACGKNIDDGRHPTLEETGE